jgi:transposase-like protein
MLATRFRATVGQKHHPMKEANGSHGRQRHVPRVPGCGSIQFKKNGHIHSGKQNHQCKACGRQFVASAEERLIADEQRTLIEHLLRERLSPRGICRAVGVSLTWLLHFMVKRFAACPEHLHVQLPVSPTDVVIRQLEAEADEMWSFVKKANKQGFQEQTPSCPAWDDGVCSWNPMKAIVDAWWTRISGGFAILTLIL